MKIIKFLILDLKILYYCLKKYIKPKKREKYVNKIKNIKEQQRILKGFFFSYSYNNHFQDEYENNVVFSDYKTDIKTICMYLPQFHAIPENDKWWGKGFTEWTNVKKAKPFFPGHYMPREPHEDFGYYNLENVEIIKNQVFLAKKHGIYGFAFYYYWFSSKKLLEKPIDNFLEHKEIDFPFMLIWANENWTRRWDGLEKEVLMKQEYKEEDPENFILDLKKYVLDDRYIRIDGKPVIGVYEPTKIPNFNEVVKVWQEKAKSLGIGDIFILSPDFSDENCEKLKINDFIDGKYFFPPRLEKGFETLDIKYNKTTFHLINYKNLLHCSRDIFNKGKDNFLYFPGAMLGWDNSARRKNGAYIWNNFNFYDFYKINKLNIYYVRKHQNLKNRFMFINAWNEWGEGTYLEPDKKFGYRAINTLSRAIFDKPYNECGENRENIYFIGDGLKKEREKFLEDKLNHNNDVKIAIQIHIFYTDLLDEIKILLKNMPFYFDLYITTDTDFKKDFIEKNLFSSRIEKIKNIFIEVFENKGRDIFPFIKQVKLVRTKYEYICHIHTKKTLFKKFDLGEKWRQYLYKNILGSSNIIYEIFDFFEKDKNLGLIFPECFFPFKKHMTFGENKNIALDLMNKIDTTFILPEDNKTFFPVGDMFWARLKAIEDVFIIEDKDIPNEEGQVDQTILHAIERLWCYFVKHRGYTFLQTRNIYDNFDL